LTTAARKRVLAVDDDPAAVGALRQILGQKGYDVVTAHSAEDALAVLADQRFDLAILDVGMPGMSGYELCRKMRKDARTVDLPVIFLTAKSTQDDIEKGLAIGADYYITKPFSGADLVRKVKILLEQHRLSHAAGA